MALTYTYELAKSNRSYWSMTWNHLANIIHEDIGVSALVESTYAMISLYMARQFYDKGKSTWETLFANVIISLCRAQKTRMAGHLAEVCLEDIRNGTLPEIPDVAYDMHTSVGRSKGRGIEHFLMEGAKLIPKAKIEDPWESMAEEIWKRNLPKQGKNDFDPNDPKARVTKPVTKRPDEPIADDTLFASSEPGWNIDGK